MSPDRPIAESDLAKALSHPLRYRILSALEQRTASPSELADEFGVPLGNLSYHVRTLRALRLIRLVSTKQRRGATEHYYRAEARPVISDEGWGAVPDIVKREWVKTSLATIGDYLREAAGRGGFARDGAHLTRLTFEVDARAWQQIAGELAGTFGRVQAIADESATRLDSDPHADRDTATVVLMLFEGGDPTRAPKRGGSQGAGKPATTRRRRTRA